MKEVDDLYYSLTIILLLSFIGFSILVWGLVGNGYALGGFGLIMILLSFFVLGKGAPRQLLTGGFLGAVFGAGVAVPLGYLLGRYLVSVFGLLAAAMWGSIVTLVLVMAFARSVLSFLPERVRNTIYGLALIAGLPLGVIGIRSGIGEIYGPVGGAALIGWQFGMIIGFLLAYQSST